MSLVCVTIDVEILGQEVRIIVVDCRNKPIWTSEVLLVGLFRETVDVDDMWTVHGSRCWQEGVVNVAERWRHGE